MTSTAYPAAKADIQGLVSLVNSSVLLNRQLASICTINGLRSSGVKADLQRRIVALITASAQDPYRLEQIRVSIQNAKQGLLGPQAHVPSHAAPSPAQQQAHINSNPGSSASPRSSMAAYQQPQGYPASAIPGSGFASVTSTSTRPSQAPPQQYTNSRTGQSPSPWFQHVLTEPVFTFKPSPFYEVISLLGDVKTCEPMVQHRSTVQIPLKAHELQRHLTDPSIKVMVFCALGNSGVQDIAFPHQAELKVNSGEVKANLRGLKNKPGSTRPVDITHLLRLRPPQYSNTVDFTYAMTNKRFYLCVYACRSHPVSSLVGRLKSGNKISRQSVVQEITRKARDTEIVTTSQVMSLKCPLSCMRLDLPVRSVACKHIQCFDATSYLQLQEQGPQWMCPICSQPAPFDKLAVDEYAREILDKSSKSTDQVTIEPTGEWRLTGAEAEEVKDEEPEAVSYNIDDDDVIISDISFFGGGRSTATPSRSYQVPSTPNTNTRASREGSSMPRSATGNKRSAPVIDLTLSDDDDDEPAAPPAKRQNTGSNGYY